MLDAAVSLAPVVPNRLAGIIVEPLSPVMVEDHKAAVIEAFCAEGSRNRALLKTGHAYWTMTRPVVESYFLMCELAQFGAPMAVKTLARRIKREVPDSTFRIQWFYDDPILDVFSGGEVHHLAIWAHGQVQKIVTTLPPRRRWFGWLSNLTIVR